MPASQCLRCSPALAIFPDTERNHVTAKCRRDPPIETNFVKTDKFNDMWPRISTVGNPSDDPGDLQDADRLLKNFQTQDQHNGMPITKRMLENAWKMVFTKKGQNQAEAAAKIPAKIPTKTTTAGPSGTTASSNKTFAGIPSKAGPAGKTMPVRSKDTSVAWKPVAPASKSTPAASTFPRVIDAGDMIHVPTSELLQARPGPLSESRQVWHDKRNDGSMQAAKKSVEPLKQRLAARPAFAEPQDSTVLTNHFAIELMPPKQLYQYHIAFNTPVEQRTRRKALVARFIATHGGLNQHTDSFATDYETRIISWQDLSNDAAWESDTQGLKWLTATVDDFQRGQLGVAGQVNITLTRSLLSWEGMIDHYNGRDPSYNYQDTATALNVIFSKGRAESRSDTFELGPSKLFYRPGNYDFGHDSPLLGIRGYTYSVRPAMGSLLLNIDIGMSAFLKPHYVSKYLVNEHYGVAALKFLIGARVRIMYKRGSTQNSEIDSEDRRTRTITGFSKKLATETYFEKDGAMTSVYDHVCRTYGNIVRGENTQCVNVGSEQRPTWFLAEHLFVLPNQRYKFKLDGVQTKKMIDQASQRPEVNREAILKEGLRAIGILPSGQSTPTTRLPMALRSSGINIDPRMLRLPARLSPQPVISYSGKYANAGNSGVWNNARLPFSTTEKQGGTVAWLSAINDDSPSRFPDYHMHLVDAMSAHSVRGFQKARYANLGSVPNWNVEALGRFLSQNASQAKLFALVLPANTAHYQARYAVFKSAVDQVAGVASVCFNDDKLKKMNWDPKRCGMGVYMSNVSMKVNVRLGNSNQGLKDEIRVLKPLPDDKTMILGIDVVHPGHSSVQVTPSIAAAVATTDLAFIKYRGMLRMNPPRQEVVESLEMMVKSLLDSWADGNAGAKPSHILCYRDGVSESQYGELHNKEINAIKSAWDKAKGRTKATQMKLTFVVVTKRHHTRLYPHVSEHTDPKTGNCRPGTVVDSGITSPYGFDFFLQSHKGLVGTARPAHYIVLENGMQFESKPLQDLTNHLCYTYARSTTAVSYVTPAYYADHLCERGKQYLKDFFDGKQELKELGAAGTPDEQWAEQMTALREMWNTGGNAGMGDGDLGTNNGNPWSRKLNDTMFWI